MDFKISTCSPEEGLLNYQRDYDDAQGKNQITTKLD